MSQVVITGWKEGCNTVAAIKELRAIARIPLNEATDVVNRVLRNEQVVVEVPNPTTAEALANSLERIGLIATSVCD